MIPLLKLPDRLTSRVFSQLTCTQLFDISCCSSKAKAKVTEYTSVHHQHPIGIFFDDTFDISTNDASFIFTTSRHIVTEDVTPAPRTFAIGGETVTIEFAHSGADHLTCVVDAHRERTLMRLVAYLVEVFHTRCDYLRVTPVFVDDMQPILNAKVFKDLKTFELKMGSVTVTEMNRFLSRFHARKWIVTANTGVEYDFQGSFNASQSVNAEMWRMSPESTAHLRTPTIILRDPPHLDNRWMNRFIRKWKHSGRDILARFEVHFTSHLTFDLEEMMRGCVPFRGRAKKNLDYMNGLRQRDFLNGLDVRKRGGRWASLTAYERRPRHRHLHHDILTVLVFVVWSEPDPHL